MYVIYCDKNFTTLYNELVYNIVFLIQFPSNLWQGRKRCEIKRGSKGLLLLMKFKFLIWWLLTRLQNTVLCLSMFCRLVIIIKNLNSINSKRLWLPLLISHVFQLSLALDLGRYIFYTHGVFDWNMCLVDKCPSPKSFSWKSLKYWQLVTKGR